MRTSSASSGSSETNSALSSASVPSASAGGGLVWVKVKPRTRLPPQSGLPDTEARQQPGIPRRVAGRDGRRRRRQRQPARRWISGPLPHRTPARVLNRSREAWRSGSARSGSLRIPCTLSATDCAAGRPAGGQARQRRGGVDRRVAVLTVASILLLTVRIIVRRAVVQYSLCVARCRPVPEDRGGWPAGRR